MYNDLSYLGLTSINGHSDCIFSCVILRAIKLIIYFIFYYFMIIISQTSLKFLCQIRYDVVFAFETRAIRLLRSWWGCLRHKHHCRLFEMRFKLIFPPMSRYSRKLSLSIVLNIVKDPWHRNWLNCHYSFLPNYITFRHSSYGWKLAYYLA